MIDVKTVVGRYIFLYLAVVLQSSDVIMMIK